MQGPGKTFDTSINWEEIDRRLSDDPVSLMADLGGSKQAKDDGGAAFPSPGVVLTPAHKNEHQQGAYEGMTLRDYFAGKAIAGLSSGMGDMCVEDVERAIPVAASISYAIADAMLRERAK